MRQLLGGERAFAVFVEKMLDEVAAYTRLLAAARLGGNAEVVRLLEDTLKQDKTMASTLDIVVEATLP